MEDIQERLSKAVQGLLDGTRTMARSLGHDADKLRQLSARCEQADIRVELIALAKEFDQASVFLLRALDSE